MAIVIQGEEHLQKVLASGNRKVTQACLEVIAEFTAEIGAESSELVPVDTGNLRRSRIMKFPTKARLQGEVAYGGTGAPYAVVQHEDETLWHPPKPPNRRRTGSRAQGTGPVVAPERGGAKYLEYPLKKKHVNYGKKLVWAINRKFAGLSK